jgi:AraC family transcriptional regulator
MALSPFWSFHPQLIQCTYWDQKQQFSYKVDTYNEWIIFAVEDGAFEYEIMQHSGTAVFGDIVVCPPGAPFYREVLTPLSFFFFRFQWMNGSDPIVPFHESMPVGKITIRDTRRLASDYYRIKQLPDLTDPFHLAWISLHLKDILYLYCFESGQPQIEKPLRRDPLMEHAVALIKQKASEPFRMKSLSDSLGLNPVQFTRRFQAARGTTPSEYLTRIRLQKACTLLITGSLTVEEVAEQCGYENGYYLSRLFSKKLKMSPSLYRRTHQL